jgi:outer membrane protein OmpA-like peptidoglycan-associated protein
MRLLKDGKEIWAYIHIDTNAESFHLTIVEKQAMTQEIVADAKFMADGLHTSGHVALYGIHFDFNKADIKPESGPALKEIASLLRSDPKLRLYVVGHTDNVGGYEYNMRLSQTRAEAVVKELVNKHEIAAARLTSGGAGPLAPVASNDTEEGRAKNRRVELVKQ